MKALATTQTTSSPTSSTDSNFFLQRKCACGGPAGLSGTCEECANKQLLKQPLQAKLVVGSVDDPLEREADRMAEQVMRMPDLPPETLPNGTGAKPQVQRRVTGNTTGTFAAPPAVHQVLSAPGRPLDTATRAFFEPRFRHDFSRVRVHTDSAAAASAQAIQAQAYTVGNHIVLGAGQYSSGNRSSGALLAHELTHVVQQSPTEVPTTVRRLEVLSSAAMEVAIANMPRVAALFTEYGAMVEAGAVVAEEVALVSAAAAEAEIAVAAAAELAAVGTTATAIGEGALVTTAALAADDVTGIGVADDVAIPFTLIAGLVGVGVGVGVAYYYRDEISAAARAAVEAVARVIELIRQIVSRGSTPRPTEVPPFPIELSIPEAPPSGRPAREPGPDHPLEPRRPPEERPRRDPPPVLDDESELRPVPDRRAEEDTRRRRRRCPLPTGLTISDPIPMVWVKNPNDRNAYPSPIDIGGHDYLMTDENGYLPRGEPLGVSPEYLPAVGKIMRLIPERRSTATRDFRTVLRSYGFDWGPSRHLQADHVQDVFWGTATGDANLDVPRNIWPMDGAANMSAGSRQNVWQVVSFCENATAPTPTVARMREMRRQHVGRFFVITAINPFLSSSLRRPR